MPRCLPLFAVLALCLSACMGNQPRKPGGPTAGAPVASEAQEAKEIAGGGRSFEDRDPIQLATLVVRRYVHSSGFVHLSAPEGYYNEFTPEGFYYGLQDIPEPIQRVIPDTVGIYSCHREMPSGFGDHFLADNPQCSYQGTNLVYVGRLFTTPQPNTVAVYSCTHQTTNYHMTTTDPNECWQNAFHPGYPLGYAPNSSVYVF